MTAGRTNTDQISKNWNTPEKILIPVRNLFNNAIELDPCSNSTSIVNSNVSYIYPNKNGLKESWNYKTIFVNPPYGSDKEQKTRIIDWIKTCYNAFITYKSEVVALIPVATNTKHWKNYIWNNASGICFLYDTRLKFLINGSEDNKGAPMACAIIYWGTNTTKFKQEFQHLGKIIIL